VSNEARQPEKHVVTNQEKSANSTHVFFDSLMSCDDDAEQSHVEDYNVADPVSKWRITTTILLS
jgi:hypothetical protein